MLEALKTDLPNFPDEVLIDWLLPYACSEGWPPSHDPAQEPGGLWRYLLGKKPLTYWRSLCWERTDCHISFHQLRKEHQETIGQMVLAAVGGQVNIYSTSIPDLKQRFFNVVDFLSVYGQLPRPPAVIQDNEGLSVVDGNHRMAAYFYCCGYFMFDPGHSLQLKTLEIQSYWIAS
jgi:hypothetical protein